MLSRRQTAAQGVSRRIRPAMTVAYLAMATPCESASERCVGRLRVGRPRHRHLPAALISGARWLSGLFLTFLMTMFVSTAAAAAAAAADVDCADFPSRSEAQEYFRLHPDDSHLDRDGDGQACEWNSSDSSGVLKFAVIAGMVTVGAIVMNSGRQRSQVRTANPRPMPEDRGAERRWQEREQQEFATKMRRNAVSDLDSLFSAIAMENDHVQREHLVEGYLMAHPDVERRRVLGRLLRKALSGNVREVEDYVARTQGSLVIRLPCECVEGELAHYIVEGGWRCVMCSALKPSN